MYIFTFYEPYKSKTDDSETKTVPPSPARKKPEHNNRYTLVVSIWNYRLF
jgi:hypothetical protein